MSECGEVSFQIKDQLNLPVAFLFFPIFKRIVLPHLAPAVFNNTIRNILFTGGPELGYTRNDDVSLITDPQLGNIFLSGGNEEADFFSLTVWKAER